MDIYFIDNEL